MSLCDKTSSLFASSENIASLLSDDINLSNRLELGSCRDKSWPVLLVMKILVFSEPTRLFTVVCNEQLINFC